MTKRLTNETRAQAIKRTRELDAGHVELWRSPLGDGADRITGFFELARVPPESEPASEATDGRADEDVTCASTQELSRAG